jgi:hypothetical protein
LEAKSMKRKASVALHRACVLRLVGVAEKEKATWLAVAHVELDTERPWGVVSSGLNALTNAVICSGVRCKVAFPATPPGRVLR